MIEEFNIETYLYISPDEYKIYLFDKKNLKNLYKNELKFKTKNNFVDFDNLEKFLEDNIFKIEKLAGGFIRHVFLVIENDQIIELNFGIKKKSYKKIINKKFLENILIDAKDLFRENYQNNNIMHIFISRYFENGNYHFVFNDDFKGDYLCVEFQFRCIPSEFISKISKVLGKYQVALLGCLDSKYIKQYFSNEYLDFPEMIYKIQSGVNENEVKLIPKNSKNMGFFEKFFQLFS